ncbi:hypothetical protein RUND412_004557 [Rhizina undulata]
MASGSTELNTVLEADSDLSNDSEYETSSYGSGFESDTTSLISAARNHTFENGRRYHGYKEGKYFMPNDEAEQDRMDLLHHCCLLALNGEGFVAPVGKDWKPQRILDLGTGSGIWAIDIADQYPTAEVIGVDLSPIQPNWVPPNLTFEVDDIEETWRFEDNSFDFIHVRNMESFLLDWPRLRSQAFKALKPGGWIEIQAFCDTFSSDDGTLHPDHSLTIWSDYFRKAAAMAGREFNTVAPSTAKAFEELGFVDVGQKITKFPIGRWPKDKKSKELGMYWGQHFIDGAEGISLALFTRVLGWEKHKVDEFLVGVYEGLRNPKIHSYSKFYCIYGRKPL